MESDNLTTFTCLTLILKGQFFFPYPLAQRQLLQVVAGEVLNVLFGCHLPSAECLGCKAVSDHKLMPQQ